MDESWSDYTRVIGFIEHFNTQHTTTILQITVTHKPASKSNSSQRLYRSGFMTHSLTNQLFTNSVPLLQCNCCHVVAAFVPVGGSVTRQRLLYSCLFRGCCLATGLHATIFCNTSILNVTRFEKCPLPGIVLSQIFFLKNGFNQFQ
jgi:hypothetical protein